jgi:hypothetical protein
MGSRTRGRTRASFELCLNRTKPGVSEDRPWALGNFIQRLGDQGLTEIAPGLGDDPAYER